jgi:hypothetical protein
MAFAFSAVCCSWNRQQQQALNIFVETTKNRMFAKN